MLSSLFQLRIPYESSFTTYTSYMVSYIPQAINFNYTHILYITHQTFFKIKSEIWITTYSNLNLNPNPLLTYQVNKKITIYIAVDWQ